MGFSSLQRGMCGALDILETKAEEGDLHIVTMLHEVLSYCERNFGKVFSLFDDAKPQYHGSVGEDHSITARLLNLCIKLGRLEEVVWLLKLLSKPFHHEDPVVRRFFEDQRVGIKDADTATAIASAVQRHGWIQCGPLVMELLIKSISVKVQGNCFIQLAFEFHRLGCEDAGLVVARRILAMTDTTCSSLHKLDNGLVVKMGKLIFRFKGCTKEAAPRFLEQMRKLITFLCCSLIVQIYAMFSEEVATEGDVRHIFKMMCNLITRKDFHQPSLLQSQIEDLLCTFVQLGDHQLLDKLIVFSESVTGEEPTPADWASWLRRNLDTTVWYNIWKKQVTIACGGKNSSGF